MTRPAHEQPGTGRLPDVTERFRELHRLGLAEHASYTSLYADYLDTGRRLLGMGIGIVSRIERDRYIVLAVRPGDIGIASGDILRLADTYCAHVVEHGETMAVPRVGAYVPLASHPAYHNSGLEAYLAAPIRIGGRIVGTLNFTNTEARTAAFAPEDRELIELMARSLGHVIERDELQQARTAATELLRENVELFENAFRYAPIGMALVDTDGRWLRVNRALTGITGYSESELLAIDFQTITHPDDLDSDLEHLQETLAGRRNSYRMEKRYFHRDGTVIWVMLSVSLVRDDSGNPRYFVSQLQDISEHKRAVSELERQRRELQRANDQLYQLAAKDALTQVLNRRAFSERLDEQLGQATRSGLPLSLLLVDVDHFKRFNDAHGHPAGDRALQQVADALRRAGRVNDMVARYGGEEFAVILPDTDADGCLIVAERARAAIAAIEGLERSITASVGGATLDPGRGHHASLNAAPLIRDADEALYNAKAAGRNRAIHAQALSA